ncbi:hypothetical protein GIB67_005456 [Kingdonia uniflora]|uniref:mRNA (guanine-N(7))-methyltransferase n=1 Tax=Kingdonia uniflora TaxID=39325 RepID=A0A7J7NHY1_9MAGN|nr:hypothetical protein GIB67_005456 [Kingdonia uniflora]
MMQIESVSGIPQMLVSNQSLHQYSLLSEANEDVVVPAEIGILVFEGSGCRSSKNRRLRIKSVTNDQLLNWNNDAVHCPEWIVPFHVFKSLAEEYDLELVFVKNFHEFIDEYMKDPVYMELMRKMDRDFNTLSQDEWEAAYLYLTFVFRKQGQTDGSRRSSNRGNNGKMLISKNDILTLDNDN